jgi:enamine deaminase RidA (YjgF/YER057c/UK114 family)
MPEAREVIHARLEELGLELWAPAPTQPWHSPVALAGDVATCSGQIALTQDGPVATGRVGVEIDVELGAECARQCALNALAQLSRALGGPDQIRSLIRVTVYIAAAPDFADHVHVANGASTLLTDVLGRSGRHCRSAIGVASLPMNTPVELDLSARVWSSS